MKKVFLVFMLVCIGLLQVAAQSFTYTDDSGAAWTCSVTSSEDKTVQITSVSNVGTEVIIPEKVSDGTEEYTVTSLVEQLFKDNTTIEKVMWASTVTSIPEGTFYNCSNLKVIENTDKVTTIGRDSYFNTGSFYGCSSLQEINIANCKLLGQQSFCFCTQLANVIGMENVETIGADVFRDCISLESADLTNCKSLGSSAFSGCSKLANVVGMGNIETINSSTFAGTSLKTVDLTNCKSLGESAFNDCSKLVNVVGMGSIETIPYYAFFKCISLQSVDLSNCKSIGSCAFYGCKSLKSVDFANCDSIGNSAFSDCTKLADVKNMGILKTVSERAFMGCISVNSIDLPKIETLGNLAFYNTGIKKVILPETLKNMGGLCFNAADYTFMSPLPAILSECNNVSYESNIAFREVSIIRVSEGALNTYKTADVWSKYADKIYSLSQKYDYDVTTTALNDKSGLEQVIGATNMKKVFTLKVAGTINSYDIFMIRNKMTNLYDLDLSDANIVANGFAYYDSYSTKDNKVGNYMFYNLKNLFSLKLPNKATCINSNACRNCEYLREIVIPDGVISIGSEAFMNCI